MTESITQNQIATVNVIKVQNHCIDEMASFPDTNDGNKEAETLFIAWAEDHGGKMSKSEKAEALDNGMYIGLTQIYLTHSNGGTVPVVPE